MEGILSRIRIRQYFTRVVGSIRHLRIYRLTVMYSLLSQRLCVCVIKEVVKIADSKLSTSSQYLKEQEFIVGEQQGNWIIYSITDRGRRLNARNARASKRA